MNNFSSSFQAELRVVLPDERPITPQQLKTTAHVRPFVSPNSKGVAGASGGRLMGDVAAARNNWRPLSSSRSSSRTGQVRSTFLTFLLFP